MQTQGEHKQVYTPRGRGKVVHILGDGGLVVEFEHGGGEIFRPEDLLLPHVRLGVRNGQAGNGGQVRSKDV